MLHTTRKHRQSDSPHSLTFAPDATLIHNKRSRRPRDKSREQREGSGVRAYFFFFFLQPPKGGAVCKMACDKQGCDRHDHKMRLCSRNFTDNTFRAHFLKVWSQRVRVTGFSGPVQLHWVTSGQCHLGPNTVLSQYTFETLPVSKAIRKTYSAEDLLRL